MKKSIFLSFVILLTGGLAAAQGLPDSILQNYHGAKTIKEKRTLLVRYVNSIRTNQEFFSRTTELIKYLQSAKDADMADYVQLQMNDQLSKTGDYITALASCLEILNRFEKKKDTQGILMAYRTLSTTYYYAGDIGKDVEYGKKAAAIARQMNNVNGLSGIYNNMSTSYAQRGIADSALFYAQEAVVFANKSKDPDRMEYVLGTLGEAYILQKKYDEALVYLRQSLNASSKYDALGIVWNLNDLSQVFLETNRHDSAKFYAYQAVNLSSPNHFNDQLQRAYQYLSKSYAKTKYADSALKYLQLAVVIKDSLYTSEKSKQVQGIIGREQTRMQAIDKAAADLKTKIWLYSLGTGLIILFTIAFIFYRNNRQKQKANTLLQNQKLEIENTLAELKITQRQLVQSEKMASLGELTAGIAHEIQNPLNFVNNFSEVSKELLDEMREAIEKGDTGEAKEIMNDVIQNLEKINHHGNRADAIVKGMLQHSRKGEGQKEPTDINVLTEEYIRLTYHGLRAKDKAFNATIKTDFDNSIGKINIIPQDIGRVILNLITNSFYAVDEKKKACQAELVEAVYEPTVSVNTKKVGNKIEINVTDNGNGIPQKILDKIFQPFFTTKPTGQGTGLGLSLSYDIVKAHLGELKVMSIENEGTTFIIQLPFNNE